MSKIGTSELLLIFAVALIVFGPSRLPVLGKFAGKTLGQLKGYVDKMTSEFEEMDDDNNHQAEKPQKTSTANVIQTQDNE
jgi:Tat protein translocase TatB subunit